MSRLGDVCCCILVCRQQLEFFADTLMGSLWPHGYHPSRHHIYLSLRFSAFSQRGGAHHEICTLIR